MIFDSNVRMREISAPPAVTTKLTKELLLPLLQLSSADSILLTYKDRVVIARMEGVQVQLLEIVNGKVSLQTG